MELIDIYRRAHSGEKIEESSYDIDHVYMTMVDLIEKYDVSYDAENPVSNDDDLADRVFNAAVEFIETVGIFCQDTSRVIKFSREEIMAAIAEDGHRRCVGGETESRREWRVRRPDENSRPWCHIGSGIYTSSDELFLKLVQGYASIKRADSMAIPTLMNDPAGHSENGEFAYHPSEVMACIHNMRMARKACEMAGRPGFPVFNVVPASGQAISTIAASHPNCGTRTSDGWLCAFYPEYKLKLDTLNKITFINSIGGNIAGEASCLLGAFCGGAEGVAIGVTAYAIMTCLLNGTYFLNFPVTVQGAISTTRPMLWGLGLGSQAISRNIFLSTYNSGYSAAGAGTKEYFYQSAAYILTGVTSGVCTGTPFPAAGVKTDGMTPLEALFHTEMSDAACQMTREQANPIVLALLEKYEHTLDTPDLGMTFPELFDLDTVTPKPFYQAMYEEVKAELKELGVPLK